MTHGVNEDYRIGFQTHYSITPIFQYSNFEGTSSMIPITDFSNR